MSIVVRAFPVAKSVADVRAFAAELVARRSEAATFYRQWNVSHESWHLQETGAGPWVIVVNVVDDPQEAAPRYAASTLDFDTWFKRRVLEVTGIDATREPLGPPTSLVYDWSDDGRPEVQALVATAATAVGATA